MTVRTDQSSGDMTGEYAGQSSDVRGENSATQPVADPATSRPIAGSGQPLSAGELVVFTDRKARRYLVTLAVGGQWHSHAGQLALDEVIGSGEGTVVRTNRNMELVVMRPTRQDYALKMKRGAQVIYPKDQAMIVGLSDLFAGAVVAEAGAGSGALTLALLDAVGPSGQVISFEQRDDHAAIARRNVEGFFGTSPDNWRLVVGDVAAELTSFTVHRVILDLLDPWRCLPAVATTLSPGGVLVAYTPGVPQVMRLTDALYDDGRFADVQTTETLVRGWHVEGLAVRPNHRMVAHTAFLTVARRVPARDQGGPPPPRHRQTGVASLPWHLLDVADEGADRESPPPSM